MDTYSVETSLLQDGTVEVYIACGVISRLSGGIYIRNPTPSKIHNAMAKLQKECDKKNGNYIKSKGILEIMGLK